MWESILGAIAGPLIGGLFGDDTSGAIEQSGADTAAAGKYAADQQYKMFQEQQANANLKYNQTRGDLSGLFGGNIGQNLATAPAPYVMPSADKLFSMVGGVPTVNAELYATDPLYKQAWDERMAIHQGQHGRGYTTRSNPNALRQQLLSGLRTISKTQGTSPAGSGITSGTMFGPTAGVNNPQIQALLQGLRGTAGNQLNLFNQFNPQTMAQDIYSKLTALGQPQRQQEQANLESRLLNQGILSGTPGQMQLTAQNEAFGQQDLARQIQAIMEARAQQQQYLSNARGLAESTSNIETQAYGPALQAAGIAAGVPINSGQPIPTGALGVQGVQAQGAANVEAANIRDSFWSSLINNQGVQSGISSLFSNIGNGNLGLSGGVPINTSPNLSGAEGLFSLINGYGGGV